MATGAYVRIIRNGKWEALEIDSLTDEELDQVEELLPEAGWKWAKFLAGWIRDNVETEDERAERVIENIFGKDK